jgi:hypothetical protein
MIKVTLCFLALLVTTAVFLLGAGADNKIQDHRKQIFQKNQGSQLS